MKQMKKDTEENSKVKEYRSMHGVILAIFLLFLLTLFIKPKIVFSKYTDITNILGSIFTETVNWSLAFCIGYFLGKKSPKLTFIISLCISLFLDFFWEADIKTEFIHQHFGLTVVIVITLTIAFLFSFFYLEIIHFIIFLFTKLPYRFVQIAGVIFMAFIIADFIMLAIATGIYAFEYIQYYGFFGSLSREVPIV